MIRTAWIAESQCIRYRGDDPDVLRRFAELDLRYICDTEPPRGIEPIIRNHVEFTVGAVSAIATPQQLANEFINHLNAQNTELRQYVTTPIEVSVDSASLRFSWYENKFHPIVFAAAPTVRSGWHIHYPLGIETGDHGVGNTVSDWLDSHPESFTNVRWFTDADWDGEKIGRATRI
jgi:hypothetical protein